MYVYMNNYTEKKFWVKDYNVADGMKHFEKERSRRRRERTARHRNESLTVLIYDSPETHANDALQLAAGLSSSAAVRVKIDVTKWLRESEIAAVSMNDVNEDSVGPRQVTVLPGIHVQRISRVQAGDSTYLKARFSTYTQHI